MTEEEMEVERLKRIIRVLENYCKKGKWKVVKNKKSFVYDYPLKERLSTVEVIEKVKNKLELLTQAEHEEKTLDGRRS